MKYLILILFLFIPLLAFGEDGYSRDKFGHGWTDLNNDCQDTRTEILIDQGTFPIDEAFYAEDWMELCDINDIVTVFHSNAPVPSIIPEWYLPYSNQTVKHPSVIDADHLVPLKEAWNSGASEWTDEQRELFANDPANLIISHRSINRAKGSKAPHEWMPPNEDFHMTYLHRWIYIKQKYDLSFTEREKRFIQNKIMEIHRKNLPSCDF